MLLLLHKTGDPRGYHYSGFLVTQALGTAL